MRKTITVQHVVTQATVDGEYKLVKKNRTKTKASNRSLPLVPQFEQALRKLLERQQLNRKVFGNAYSTEYLDYILVNELGELMKPGFICTLFFLSIKVWILFCLLVVFLQNYKGGFAMDLSHLQGHYEELLNYMEQKGYSDTYISRFREEIQRILKRADDNAWESYRDIYKEYEQIPHSNDYLRNKRTIIGALEQFDINGLFPDGRRRHSLSDRGSYHLLLPEFKELIDFYSDAERKRGKKESTIYVEAHNAASFLFHMQLRGCSSLETVAEEDVLSFFSTETGENIRSCSYRKNISAVLKAGKAWKKTECQRLLAFLPMLREKRKNIQYLTDGEMADIRSAAAQGRLSLRDTAIVYLLIYTGLRGCDIAALTLDSVDWSRDLLHICQQKTNEPLEIPLLPVVGNAIFDYLQSGRPFVDDPHLFLRETKHYTPLCSRSIGSIVATVLKTLGIRQNSGDRKGTHIFRHNLAATLLGNGIPRPVISQTLGHSSPDSLEPYLRADFIHLKECSISIASFPVGKGVFGK